MEISDQIVARKCSCGRANCRPRQRNCHLCHSETSKKYRKARKADRERTEQLLENLAYGNNQTTRKLFEEFFKDRYVIVVAGHSWPNCNGYVIGFHPDHWISVMTLEGAHYEVPLTSLKPDSQRKRTGYGGNPIQTRLTQQSYAARFEILASQSTMKLKRRQKPVRSSYAYGSY